jgi:FKBP-type peptidyl-prolyl cis-trans isomerase
LGEGVYPVLSDYVVISYTTSIIDPANQTMSVVEEVPKDSILLSSTLSGIQQGLLLFPGGSIGKLYIPSGLAFGANPVLGSDNKIKIPANSNLLYEITKLTVKSSKLPADLTTIDSYLQSNSITPKKDSISEIRYVIDSTGTSNTSPTDLMKISWNAEILNGSALPISSKDTTISIKNQITGLRVMLPKFHVGDSVTLYIPSGYGYGSNTQSIHNIPANSNLIYHIKLIKN